jgi:ABC-2 type transport system ATP-binding protein
VEAKVQGAAWFDFVQDPASSLLQLDLMRVMDKDRAIAAAAGVSKRYGSLQVLDRVNLVVSRGEIFALLGPNGAGKTTLMEIMEGHCNRDAGDLSVLGADPEAGGRNFRNRIGIVLQEPMFEPLMTARELLSLRERIYAEARKAEEMIELFELGGLADNRLGKLSGGQRRRIELALALIGRPELLFLDEPTGGLDPDARQAFWSILKREKTAGTAILLATHSLEETDLLADRAAILNSGQIVFAGDLEDVRLRAGCGTRISFKAPRTAIDCFAAVTDSVIVEAGESSWEMRCLEPASVLHRLTGCAISHGIELRNLEVRAPSFSDVYRSLIDGSKSFGRGNGAERCGHE